MLKKTFSLELARNMYEHRASNVHKTRINGPGLVYFLLYKWLYCNNVFRFSQAVFVLCFILCCPFLVPVLIFFLHVPFSILCFTIFLSSGTPWNNNNSWVTSITYFYISTCSMAAFHLIASQSSFAAGLLITHWNSQENQLSQLAWYPSWKSAAPASQRFLVRIPFKAEFFRRSFCCCLSCKNQSRPWCPALLALDSIFTRCQNESPLMASCRRGKGERLSTIKFFIQNSPIWSFIHFAFLNTVQSPSNMNYWGIVWALIEPGTTGLQVQRRNRWGFRN